MVGQGIVCLGESKIIVNLGVKFLIRADIGICGKSVLTFKIFLRFKLYFYNVNSFMSSV